MAKEESQSFLEKHIWWLPGIFGFIIIFGIVLNPFVIIDAGHRGVVLNFGQVQPDILGEGIHIRTPIQQNIISMDVRTQKYQVDAEAATQDLLDVTTTIAINYHLEPEKVNAIYQTIGADFEQTVIAPAVEETVKQVTARFIAEHLITNRTEVKLEIETSLHDRLITRGINVETISIINFAFPSLFNDAITAKQTALQLKEKAENDLLRIQVEAQQKVAAAQGDAQAIEIVQLQLAKNPTYIQYLATTKWNGVLPIATSGVPFINIPINQTVG